MKLTDIYNMDIYSDAGSRLGEVQDLILDLEKGEVSRLLLTKWKNVRGDVKGALKAKSILYKNVKNVGDVVLISAPTPTSIPGEPATKEEVNDLSR